MRRRLRAALAMVGLLVSCPVSLSVPALAQFRSDTPPSRSDAFDPFDLLDGPADTPGCVRECVRDFNPCDPPSFKQIDGRCKHTHGS